MIVFRFDSKLSSWNVPLQFCLNEISLLKCTSSSFLVYSLVSIAYVLQEFVKISRIIQRIMFLFLSYFIYFSICSTIKGIQDWSFKIHCPLIFESIFHCFLKYYALDEKENISFILISLWMISCVPKIHIFNTYTGPFQCKSIDQYVHTHVLIF
jgi:hypothetical protein